MERRYDKWLFIDHSDLYEESQNMTVEDWKKAFPGCFVKGSRQKFVGNWADVEYLSVIYSSVTSTILNRCPNLKWVFVRAHEYHCVDIGECRRRGIGVATSGGHTESCSEYLLRGAGERPFLMYGHGRIAKRLEEKVGGFDFVVDSKTPIEDAMQFVRAAKTIFTAIPKPANSRPPVFGKRFFESCCGARLVSVSHEPLIDNTSLLEAVQSGRISRAVMDCLDKPGRDALLETGKVEYTKDTAWSINFDQYRYQNYIRNCIDVIEKSEPQWVWRFD